MTLSRKAVVLFGHGSRDPAWRGPIEAVAARVVQLQPGLSVLCTYLELDQPDLATGVARLVADGASEITVVPMFLGTGRHARNDLPVLVDTLRQTYAGVTFALQQAVGEDPRVVNLLAAIALE
jgi:sirohydrochlorin cobaltochelatase